jgi:dCMP deaminase
MYSKVLKELLIYFCEKKNNNGNYVFTINDNIEIIIDYNTYFLLVGDKWSVIEDGIINSKKQILSHLLLNYTKTDNLLIIEHINGNIYDNRKCNLRLITRIQKHFNNIPNDTSSKYIGVSKNGRKWNASIIVNNKNIVLGVFDREQDAGLARDHATKLYYKNNGKLNFPERPDWDTYFMEIAEAVKLRSVDYHKVGSILVSLKDRRIISTGYNSFASSTNDNIDLSQRRNVYDRIIHSEMNVLLYSQSQFEDSVLYTTTTPCKDCLKLLFAARIKKIIYKHKYRDFKTVQKLSKEYDIELIEYINNYIYAYK